MRPALLFLLGLMSPAPAADPVTWDTAKADHRVVVVRAESAADPRLAEQRRRWNQQREGLALRDVVIWEWTGASDLRRWPDGVQLDVRARLASIDPALVTAPWRVVLIGRDGGAKASWDRVVGTSEVFDLIDAMPMGRREMAERERRQRVP